MRQLIHFLLTAVMIAVLLPAAPSMAAESGEKPEDPLKLYAQSAVLLDASTGRVLYGKNEETVRPMASTTKIMTCIIALENEDLDGTVTASSKAASQPEVHLGVRKGEQYRLKDLLYSLMLESHNDSAVMIAEAVGGSVEGFAGMMNQKARDLGLKHTFFITPNGLDASVEENGEKKEHATTAAELGRIMDYCIGISPKREEFLAITGTQNYTFTDLGRKRSFSCVNHNAFLTMMEGMMSGKTGFTGGAGYSYVGALKDGDRVFTIALLGCGWPPHKTYKWSDARKLFQYGKENYHYRDVYQDQVLPKIAVQDGIPSSGDLQEQAYAACTLGLKEEERHLSLLLSDQENVEIAVTLPETVSAPIERGQAAGEVVYRLNGETVKTYPIFFTDYVERISAGWCMKKVAKLFLALP